MENFDNTNNEDLKTTRRKLREDRPVITERSIEEYEVLFGVKFSEMKGKTILDIGSGRGDFHDRVSALGVKVFSLNPEFKKGKNAKYAEQILHKQGDVGARAQELPFADNSFDSEFALYSIPFHLPRFGKEGDEKFFYEEFERSIEEIVRTLKPGGKAYIFPITAGVFDDTLITKEILTKHLDVVNYTIENNRLYITKKQDL